jgi:hypothetical protein
LIGSIKEGVQKVREKLLSNLNVNLFLCSSRIFCIRSGARNCVSLTFDAQDELVSGMPQDVAFCLTSALFVLLFEQTLKANE